MNIGCFKTIDAEQVANTFLRLFILFYFCLPHNNSKNIGKEEKKKWRGDLTETIEAYERLGLLELRARAVSHQLKKRWRKVEDGKILNCFHIYSIIYQFTFFQTFVPFNIPTCLKLQTNRWNSLELNPWQRTSHKKNSLRGRARQRNLPKSVLHMQKSIV